MLPRHESPVYGLDTMSGPITAHSAISLSPAPSRVFNVSPSIDLTKRNTKICRNWQQGECAFGDRCTFAHGDNEKISTRHKRKDKKHGKTAHQISLTSPNVTPLTPQESPCFSVMNTPVILDETPQHDRVMGGLRAEDIYEMDEQFIPEGEHFNLEGSPSGPFLKMPSTPAMDTISLSSSAMFRMDPYGGPFVTAIPVDTPVDVRPGSFPDEVNDEIEGGISDEPEEGESLSHERIRGRCTPIDEEFTGVSTIVTPRGTYSPMVVVTEEG